ncbi:MAG TPA: VOC family protein [Flavobacteriales bacterium]|nr:VOC family protein [Flavobacteriales bacterium]HNU56041.1 VOC family protein [Flavobacteriales bacterium]
MDNTTNALNWFEIATRDLDRAQKFYETVFGIRMEAMDMPNLQMRTFPGDGMNGKVGGALVKSGMHKPSKEGALIYLNANPDLSVPLSRVEAAGGKVLMPKTHISDAIGYMAFFEDTEGNAVAMHSQG